MLLDQVQPVIEQAVQQQQLVIPVDVKWIIGIIGSIALLLMSMVAYWIKSIETKANQAVDLLGGFKDHVSVTYKQKSDCKQHETSDLSKAISGVTKMMHEFNKGIDGVLNQSKRMELIISHIEKREPLIETEAFSLPSSTRRRSKA